MADRQQRQDQLRESMEQLSLIKKELRSMPHLEIVEKIGSGSFGDIYKVWDSRRSRWAAVKFEKRDRKNKFSLIKKEAQIMNQMKGSKYFAVLYDSRFNESATYSFIEMAYLGANLESLKKRTTPQGRFSLRTVLLLANQMLTSIAALHDQGILHRDIKPENYVIGNEGSHHQLYLIDFGLSKYHLQEDGTHIPMKQNKGLIGTARYTSISSHAGLEQSRRDDLESIAYLLLYFVKGTLVWQNLQVKDKDERFKMIAELKATTSPEEMCRGLPAEFLAFIKLVKALAFEEKPDYEAYKQLFSSCYAANYATPEHLACFDWCPKNCLMLLKANYIQMKAGGGAAAALTPKGMTVLNKQVQFSSSNSIPQFNGNSVLLHQQPPQQEVNNVNLLAVTTTALSFNFAGNNQVAAAAAALDSVNNQATASFQIKVLPSVEGETIAADEKKDAPVDEERKLGGAAAATAAMKAQSPRVEERLNEGDTRDEDDFDCTSTAGLGGCGGISELKQHEFTSIPVFKTEDNSLKNLASRFNLSVSPVAVPAVIAGSRGIPKSETLIAVIYGNEDQPLLANCQSSLRMETMPSPRQAVIAKDNAYDWLSPSGFIEELLPQLHADNSQYVNNDNNSNEWSSRQDEKVHASHVNQAQHKKLTHFS